MKVEITQLMTHFMRHLSALSTKDLCPERSEGAHKPKPKVMCLSRARRMNRWAHTAVTLIYFTPPRSM